MTAWDVRVECAFDTAPSSASPAWEDITTYARPVTQPISIDRGRPNEFGETQPSRCSILLDNSDGRFTAGLASSPYYPGVRKGRRLRVGVRYPTATAGNFLTANQASMETSIATWIKSDMGFAADSTLAQSATHVQVGAQALRVTWPTAASSGAGVTVTGLTVGRVYTASMYAWVTTGTPDVQAFALTGILPPIIATGSTMSTKSAMTRFSVTFTATAMSHVVGVRTASASTAGQQIWVDAAQVDEGSAVVPYTTANPPIFWRYDGYVDQWPQDWPAGVSTYALASIQCTDKLARMGRASGLRSMLEEEILADDPVAYYTLGEPAGAVAAGNTGPTGQPALTAVQFGTGGTVTFGSGTGPGTDSLTAAVFAPVDANNGVYLAATLTSPLTVYPDGGVGVECFFNTTTPDRTILGLAGLAGAGLRLCVKADGSLMFRESFGPAGSGFSAFTVGPAINDGLTHHAAITYSSAGGPPTTYKGYLDGVLVISGSSSSISPGPYTSIVVGGDNNGMFDGTVSHAAVFAYTAGGFTLAAARIAAHAAAGLTGFAGEGSGARIARLARYAGITQTAIETGMSSNLAAQQASGATPLALMRAVELTESGLLFVDTVGNLTFQGRDHRYNQTSTLTLDMASGHIAQGLGFSLDDQFLVNDVTASREGGVTVRAVNQASIDEYDPYKQTLTLVTASDNEVQAAADWRVNRYADPQPRCPQVPVNLHANLGLIASMADLELGDLITLTTLPSNAPAATVTLNVEGYTETLGPTTWSMSLNTSPGTTSSAWQLDSATFSVLGTSTRLVF